MSQFTHRMHVAKIVVIAALTLATAAQARIDSPDRATIQGARVRQICETILRVQPGEADFNGCVSGLTDSLGVGNHDDAAQTIQIAADPDASRSYYAVSNGDRFHREQLACAQLGFDAGWTDEANDRRAAANSDFRRRILRIRPGSSSA
jgi:hypothetical protein